MELESNNETTQKPRFQCTVTGCSKAFTKNRKLISHVRLHNGERPFVCDERNCDKTYTNSSHLLRHKKVSHTGNNEGHSSVICEFEGCGLALANKYSLKKHFNNKHNIENYAFKCLDCSQGFHKKKQLQKHQYLHTGKAAFKCDKCEMSFTGSYYLKKHQRSHKIYTCECKQKFHRWSLFLKHRKNCPVYNLTDRFQCDICKKKLNSLFNLKVHKKIHLNESERQIVFCPKPNCHRFYFYKKNLTQHINLVHEKLQEPVRYQCTYPGCKVLLKTKRIAKLHELTHFKWKKKTEIKPRKDKGTKKRSEACILSGFDKLFEKNINQKKKSQGAENIEKENKTEVANKNLEDICNEDLNLLNECELVLAHLQQKIKSNCDN